MKFEVPENLRFTCSRCGDCCRHYDILLGPGEEKRLAGLDWPDKAPELAGRRPFTDVAGLGGKKRRLTRKEDGSCAYLGAGNQCLIHEHFGGEIKPLICRLYPFAFYPVGSRIGVDVAFACQAISRNEGEEVAERLPEWARLAFDGEPKDRRRHYLRDKTPISGDLIWEYEFHLAAFLKDRSFTFPNRILACLQFLKLTSTGNPQSPKAAIFREAIAAGIPKQIPKLSREETMDSTQRAIFYTLLFLCLSQQPGELSAAGTMQKIALQDELTKEAESFRENQGQPFVNGRHLSAGFDRIAAVDASYFRQTEVPLLERYFTSKIIGKRYLVRPAREMPLADAARQFFFWFPMCVWTSKALAADEGENAVDARHVRMAIRLLDRRTGTIDFKQFDKKLRDALEFLLEETDYVNAATNEMMGLEKTGVIREEPPNPGGPSL